MKDNMTNSKSDKLSSIILIISYFGKFPNYFQLFLNSCGNNSSINWLIVTDNEEPYDYPSNMKVERTSFSDFRERVQKLYDFDIKLSSYYKICDYKPAYGELFKDEVKNFDFWGHCDCDLIFGDIRFFLPEEKLDKYDKIGHLGHFTLYKNTEENNIKYRLPIIQEDKEIHPYKMVFQKDSMMGFDEWNWPWYSKEKQVVTINDIYRFYNEKVDYINCFSDLTPFTDHFIESYYEPTTNSFSSIKTKYYQLIDGKLFTHMDKKCEERLYVHFLKRKMSVSKELGLQEHNFVMVPNSFVPEYTLRVKIKSNLLRFINPQKKQRDYKVFKGKIVKTVRKIQNK